MAALHDYLRKKTAIQSEKCLTDAKKNQGGVKWAWVNTGTYFISMCVVPIKMQYGNSIKVQETHALLDNCSQGTFINNPSVKGQKASITIKTLNREVAMTVKGLKVTSENGDLHDWFELSDTNTKK